LTILYHIISQKSIGNAKKLADLGTQIGFLCSRFCVIGVTQIKNRKSQHFTRSRFWRTAITIQLNNKTINRPAKKEKIVGRGEALPFLSDNIISQQISIVNSFVQNNYSTQK
jgi:hypothetical protein